MKAYIALYHPVIDSFRELGEGRIQNKLANGELPTQVKDLEKFVCRLPSLLQSRTCYPELR